MCYADCDCDYPPQDLPCVSEWGLIVLGLLLVAGGTVVLTRRQRKVRLNMQ